MAPVRIAQVLGCFLLLGTATPACSQPSAEARPGPEWRDLNRAVVDDHILPRYGVLAGATARLDAQVRGFCTGPTETGLAQVREGFATALDAWNGIAHIRFGPVESEQRYFRFQLWPDQRGTGQRQVRQFLANQDSARLDPTAFARESVANQGLSALEMLLYPEGEVGPTDFAAQGENGGGPGYRCRFALAIADNLAAMAAATLADWTQGQRPYRLNLLEPGLAPAATPGAAPDGGQARFADDRAVSAELLKALNTGAQVVHQIKLAGPLGAAGQAVNPHKAESWRSRRSLANVCTNLRALDHLYATGFAPRLGTTPETVQIDHGLALTSAAAVSACLSQPGTVLDEAQTRDQRKALEDLRDLVFALQTRTGRGLAEALDLMLGFNSLDGD